MKNEKRLIRRWNEQMSKENADWEARQETGPHV